MTAVTASLGAMLAPAAAPGARRGAGDSSDAFGRSLAAASEEAAGPGDAPTSGEGSSVVGTVPDGAAHPVRPGRPGTSGGQASPGASPEAAVPGAAVPGAPAGVVAGTGDPDGPGESTGVEGDVAPDEQPVPVVPVVPPLVPPGAAELPVPVGLPGDPGAAGVPGAVTDVVVPPPAGPEEQAVVPVPPAGSAALPTDGSAELLGHVTAQGTGLRGDPTGTPAAGGTAASAQPVGTATVPPAPAGQPSGGGAGGSSDGARQFPGAPVTAVQGPPQGPGEVPAGTVSGAASETDGGADGAPAPTTALGQVVPAPVPVAPTPVSTAVGPVVAATPPSPQAAPTLHAQVSGPVFQLLAAGDGDHVLTLSVTPDNLGPVTVRAHIAGGDLRIELFAPHDAGREALRALAAELRRDLAGIAPSASLSVSDAKEAPAQGSGHQAGPGNGSAGDAGSGTAARPGDQHPWQSRPGTRPGVPGATTDPTIQPTVDDRTPGAARRLDVLV
ncbi:flagellar hook-length control protein FliK [Oerskovia jenensis]|uniref:flagellar hook-length control protein FliK n=1 Tax=Oerskovia jenensis TaxID=162169 RepID=UPI0031D10ABC